MAGKSRSAKSRSTRSRQTRAPRQAFSSSDGAAVAPVPPVAAAPPTLRRNRGVDISMGLAQATEARYPYVTGELRQVGIFAAAILVLLLILFFVLT